VPGGDRSSSARTLGQTEKKPKEGITPNFFDPVNCQVQTERTNQVQIPCLVFAGLVWYPEVQEGFCTESSMKPETPSMLLGLQHTFILRGIQGDPCLDPPSCLDGGPGRSVLDGTSGGGG
jgi:hypothetical protein